MELIALDCLKNKISTDIETPKNNLPPLDGADEGYKVSTYREINFSSSVYPSTEVSTVFDITPNSASLLAYTLVTSTIGSQHTT